MGHRYRQINYNPNTQILAMRGRYPNFTVKKHRDGRIVFSGRMTVRPEFDEYEVQIIYRGGLGPEARILSPKFGWDAPHILNGEGLLCLYKEDIFQWKEHYLIADYIIGWVAEWIYFYEAWKESRRFEGPEAPHPLNTPKTDEENTTSENN